ncbi:SPFH domain-containing protein [Streptomyces sp. DSM 42041]|uniref:SPFH domain-containing protein n=1 Tax=Streptomyces hazeniae TaxID=3075538 RepID=A0ABU2NYI4_9ACTN|nr:SPFH domain-containing protein [Streptomyces sp. DSM 42041]MDT0382033.1 SPFH domain-containing protein [Streptomyces sp. DSM 42041]
MVNRPPQWHQAANRHTSLTDPVITIQELSRFKPLRTTRIDYALVFTTARGTYDTYLPPRRPGRADFTTKRWQTVYEVDMGVHRSDTRLSLPSDDDAFSFGVAVDITWQVTDPARFVASGERDVNALVARQVEQLARHVSRQFPVQDSPGAERSVQKAVEASGPLGEQEGLRVSCILRLTLDEDTLAHRRDLRNMRYEGEKLDPAHELRMREDALAAERALAQERQHHHIAVERQTLGHQRALLHGEQQVELQAIEAKKIEFYQYHLQQGGVRAWAFHLAQHPEDSRLVLENMREDQLRLLQTQMELASQVISGKDGLEEHEMAEPRRLALQAMHEILQRRLPGVVSSPELPQGGDPSAADRPGTSRQAQPGPDPHAAADPARPTAPPGECGPPSQAPPPPGPPPGYGYPQRAGEASRNEAGQGDSDAPSGPREVDGGGQP